MPKRNRPLIYFLLSLGFLTAVVFGIALGLALSSNRNIQSLENLQEHKPALPTRILDRNGRLITQFFSDQKREIVSIDEMPDHLIEAILTREDQYFYDHNGFRIQYIVSAAKDIILGRSFRGGSTITQQVAGLLYSDRTEITIRRKLEELWWALQLERQLTKNEILERYLNLIYLGHNTNGVEAASQFYFRHSIRDITLAEAAMLVVQTTSPGLNSPINHPNRAKKIQREILDQMVELGYVTFDDADFSFAEYWDSYDYTRSSATSAWFEREDKARYFSEYIRQQLEDLLLGSVNIYEEGLIVHTTLDLDRQAIADKVMDKWIKWVNDQHQNQADTRLGLADTTFLPFVDLLSLAFNIEGIRFAGSKQQSNARGQFLKEINPVMDVLSSIFGLPGIKYTTRVAYNREFQLSKKTQVEGALISIDSKSGHIYAMVGGRRFEATNQFNRAVQSKVQPGSAFKPLYYSAAIGSGLVTPATMIVDAPVVFWNDDGTQYTPLNYKGEWKGRVLLRYALSHSMNVPSLKVLDKIGFDAAITRASRMLGITDPERIEKTFPRKYPLGLGIIAVSPLQMARAFATFPNEGRAVEPLSIRYIEDRNGRLVLEPEKELRTRQARAGEALQIMSPQNAYIMVNLLETTVKSGTLYWATRNSVGGFDRPIAGKTGTTQNWSDAWTVGFTPQMTTAVWFGFDKRALSLGVNLTGATVGGPAWSEYMKEAHQGLPVEEFTRPNTGLIEVTVCAISGQLPTKYCNEGTIGEIFISGTEPREFCEIHPYQAAREEVLKNNIKNSILLGNTELDPQPLLDLFLDDFELPPGEQSGGSTNPLLD